MELKEWLAENAGSSIAEKRIEDEQLLAYARSADLDPWQAQSTALAEGILPYRYEKNLTALSLAEQARICGSRVFVCGCGGLGGTVLTLLARLGVGHLRFADGDRFAASNLNRQWFADTKSLDRPKAETAAELLRRINPLLEIDARQQPIHEENVQQALDRVDLVVDALDNIPVRFILAEAALKNGITFVHGAVAGWWGQVSTFLPDSSEALARIYGERRSRDPAEQAMGVLGAAASTIGSLQALEATRILAGRAPAYADKLLYFDGESGQMELIPLTL